MLILTLDFGLALAHALRELLFVEERVEFLLVVRDAAHLEQESVRARHLVDLVLVFPQQRLLFRSRHELQQL